MFEVGHWPYYNHPDPKNLEMPLYYGTAAIAFLVTVLFFVLIPITLVITGLVKWKMWAPKKKRILVTSLVLYSFGLGVWVIDGRVSGLATWILD